MKMHSYNVAQVGGKASLVITASDRMKRPVNITVTVTPTDVPQTSPVVALEEVELAGLLGIFAEIAWSRFMWRPRALVAAVAHLITNFKMPPAAP